MKTPLASGMTRVEFPGRVRLQVRTHRTEQHDFAEWERDLRRAIVGHLRPGAVVFDIGSEEGESGALAAAVAGPSNVFVFEPAPWYWPSIRAVWEANFPDRPPGGCWPGFVAAEPRLLDYRRLARASVPGWPAESRRPLTERQAFVVHHERPEIPAIPLDDYARARGVVPEVILMDVEGAEGLVLTGAETLLRTARPTVFAAVHREELLEPYGWDHARLWALLEEVGYDAELIADEKHEAHHVFRPRGES